VFENCLRMNAVLLTLDAWFSRSTSTLPIRFAWDRRWTDGSVSPYLFISSTPAIRIQINGTGPREEA
jgi:hypothetical protein